MMLDDATESVGADALQADGDAGKRVDELNHFVVVRVRGMPTPAHATHVVVQYVDGVVTGERAVAEWSGLLAASAAPGGSGRAPAASTLPYVYRVGREGGGRWLWNLLHAVEYAVPAPKVSGSTRTCASARLRARGHTIVLRCVVLNLTSSFDRATRMASGGPCFLARALREAIEEAGMESLEDAAMMSGISSSSTPAMGPPGAPSPDICLPPGLTSCWSKSTICLPCKLPPPRNGRMAKGGRPFGPPPSLAKDKVGVREFACVQGPQCRSRCPDAAGPTCVELELSLLWPKPQGIGP